jgi:hypothetical protein
LVTSACVANGPAMTRAGSVGDNDTNANEKNDTTKSIGIAHANRFAIKRNMSRTPF